MLKETDFLRFKDGVEFWSWSVIASIFLFVEISLAGFGDCIDGEEEVPFNLSPSLFHAGTNGVDAILDKSGRMASKDTTGEPSYRVNALMECVLLWKEYAYKIVANGPWCCVLAVDGCLLNFYSFDGKIWANQRLD